MPYVVHLKYETPGKDEEGPFMMVTDNYVSGVGDTIFFMDRSLSQAVRFPTRFAARQMARRVREVIFDAPRGSVKIEEV